MIAINCYSNLFYHKINLIVLKMTLSTYNVYKNKKVQTNMKNIFKPQQNNYNHYTSLKKKTHHFKINKFIIPKCLKST